MTEAEQKLLEQSERLNANLEALLAIIQSDALAEALAEALEVAKDIRFLLAKLTGHEVK